MMLMGIPVRSRDTVHHVSRFLKSSCSSKLKDRTIKSLTGNAMHSCVVGSLVLCMLRSVQLHPPQPNPRDLVEGA